MKTGIDITAMFAALVVAGCGPINAAINCNAICSRYQDCFDQSYDVNSCTTRCNSHSSNDTADENYRRTAAECNACMGDTSCASATFNCGAQCASVVP